MKTNNFFKRFCGAAMVALAMAMPLFTSCYDDSALNKKLEDIQAEVDELKSDLAALQAAVDNNLSVVDYKQIEGGYELTMSDGSTITILNGKDGAAGADGKDGNDGEKGEKSSINQSIQCVNFYHLYKLVFVEPSRLATVVCR